MRRIVTAGFVAGLFSAGMLCAPAVTLSGGVSSVSGLDAMLAAFLGDETPKSEQIGRNAGVMVACGIQSMDDVLKADAQFRARFAVEAWQAGVRDADSNSAAMVAVRDPVASGYASGVSEVLHDHDTVCAEARRLLDEASR